MRVKKILRGFGYDIRRYHSLYDTVLKHHDIRTILDIGANDGYWATDIRALLPEAQIYAFEPLRDCFEKLGSKFKNDKNFKSFNFALGDTDGTTEIERSSFHPSSSILTMAQLHKDLYPKSAKITHEQIEIKRLDSITDLEIDLGLLVKMDVQGFEDKVISGGRSVLSKADVIIIETSFVTLYENQPLFGDIHDTLRGLGFSYKGNCGEHFSKKTGERIYEDSVFVRQGD